MKKRKRCLVKFNDFDSRVSGYNLMKRARFSAYNSIKKARVSRYNSMKKARVSG
jgi:hypothetical protein